MKNLDYRIGLDIGTNSVGWSVIELNFNQTTNRYEKVGIIDFNVRMFNKAEIPKTGAPLAEPRRQFRSTRRQLKRKSIRKQKIRQLLVTHDVISQQELDNLYPLSKGSIDIWDIRVEGLDRYLNKIEWSRLLLHLAQRRGFKSNRKSDNQETEQGKILPIIQENKQLLCSYRTVGEMWMKDEKFATSDKRKNTNDNYLFNVSREDLKREIQLLFQQQRQFGSLYASEQTEKEYLDIWEHQLPFASGHDILKKVGYCSLEPKERRIPKATYTFQYFTVIDKLNNLRLGSHFEPLTKEQRDILLQKIMERTDFINKKTIPSIRYSDIRKWLTLDDSIQFKGLIYEPDEKTQKIEKKEFVNLKPYYEIKKVILLHSEKTGETYTNMDLDTIGYALTVYKTDKDIRAYLRNPHNLSQKVFDDTLIDELLNLSYTKFGHLSIKALRRLLPYLEEGLSYAEAVNKVGYDTTNLKGKKKERLLPQIPDDITNPVVKRSLTQARKVVNAIIRKYGSPLSVHIELARELSKNASERKKLSKAQTKNYERNQGAIAILVENGILNPTGYDIVRYKLWKEQNERCIYSLRKIPAEQFFAELRRERGSTPLLDVDHILPYSQSFLDGYDNKVLVFSDENRKKGDRIPFDYLQENPKKWLDFEAYVQSNEKLSKKKRGYLVKKVYTARESDDVKERHLNDTRYATRFLKNFIEQFLVFKETQISMKKRVQTLNGRITSHFRSRWGFEKIREDTYLHHAVDAVVVACTDQHMVNKVTDYYKSKEQSLKPNAPYFPWPWEGFRDEVLTCLHAQPVPDQIKQAITGYSPLPDYRLVSRMSKHSVTGAAHKETIMMNGGENNKTGKTIIVKRMLLKEIKFDDNGDFKMVGKEQDPATYQAIKQRYLSYDKDAKRAFEKPLYKPSKKGHNNLIKRVKVEVQEKTFVREVNGGVAENGDLVRIDLFKKEDTYYMIPIYVLDTSSPELPDHIVTSGKGYKLWKKLDESYTFQFSLTPYDLIRVKINEKDQFLYFSTIDISNNRIICKHVNKPSVPKECTYSLTKIEVIEKCKVGILSDVSFVKNETRRSFGQPTKKVALQTR